jgi:alpha-ketoglutarate-dependent taurine dioxygenase
MMSAFNEAERVAGSSPFSLESDAAYLAWRERKLEGYPKDVRELLIPVSDPRALTPAEAGAIRRLCRKTNMAVYQSALGPLADKAIPRQLGDQFGLIRLDSNLLADEDAISSITVVPGKGGRGYIPYTNHRLQWHTDGYYNPSDQQVRAIVLHCVQSAARGGENGLLDHEIVYIHLRDANPDYVRALMGPEAMTIPANTETGTETRAAQTGPVFSVDPATGSLHMRYTARTRSIIWKDDVPTRAAVRMLEEILAGDTPYLFRHRLNPGEGLICNNVLHSRTAFEDDPAPAAPRLLYRARYFDRIAGTGLNEPGN